MANESKRATIYFDPDLHKALRLKTVETSRSMSEARLHDWVTSRR